MTEFNELQDIWKRQGKIATPDVELIIAKARKEKLSLSKKIIIQTAVLLPAVVVVTWIVLAIDFKMLTTYIGIFLVLATILAFSGIRLHQVFQLRNIDFTAAPKKVLVQLEKFYAFQQFVGTTCMLLYFILLNVALGLYFIEVMQPMSWAIKIVSLIIYIIWMLISYFYIGKKQKAKEYAKTESLIRLIKQIEKDFN